MEDPFCNTPTWRGAMLSIEFSNGPLVGMGRSHSGNLLGCFKLFANSWWKAQAAVLVVTGKGTRFRFVVNS